MKMMSNGKCINIAFISDIHLGNRLVPAANTIKGLVHSFSDTVMGKLDMVVIAGDLFDSELTLSQDAVIDIQLWMIYFLKRCRRFNVKLRSLEGTPSHDRGQNSQLPLLNSAISKDEQADLRYYDKLTIDHEEDYDMDFLYVPDEWRHDVNDTWNEVLELLGNHGIDKVDFSIMHGMFKYQIPEAYNMVGHSEDNYLSITRRYITIGHVHTMTTFDRILAQGSFDCVRHGEPGTKGFFIVKSHENQIDDKITFMENKHVTPFTTIDICGVKYGDAVVLIEKEIYAHTLSKRKALHIRLAMPNDDIAKGIYSGFKKDFPDYIWSNKIVKPKLKPGDVDLVAKKIEFKPINKNTINGLILEDMKSANENIGDDILEEAMEILNRLKQAT